MTVTAEAPLAVFDSALRRAGAGLSATMTMYDDLGGAHVLDAAAWCRGHLPGDGELLARCSGPTLDVGCGPGRLTAALNRLGRPALGIDVSAAAVRLARARGANALRRDVFATVPGHGGWRNVLLADGNIGIGGHPQRLLRRCRDLLAPDGRLHVELARPGTRSWSGDARISTGDGTGSAPFRWAVLAAGDIALPAALADLRVRATWNEADRWFATLAPA